MGLRQEIWDTLVNGIIHPACGTVQSAFKDLFFVLFVNRQHEISLADRTTENIHQRASHTSSSLKSIIWVTSGPVDMRVMGLPISSSASFKKSLAFLVSFA